MEGIQMEGIQDLYPRPGIIRNYSEGGALGQTQTNVVEDIKSLNINWKQVIIAFILGYLLGGRRR